jgi:hypothetical protein
LIRSGDETLAREVFRDAFIFAVGAFMARSRACLYRHVGAAAEKNVTGTSRSAAEGRAVAG